MSNAAEMDAQEIINYIATAPKKTPVKLYVREKPGMKVAWGDAHVYGGRRGKTVFGDWVSLRPSWTPTPIPSITTTLKTIAATPPCPMLDLKGINARIEPGAIIRRPRRDRRPCRHHDGRHHQHRLRYRRGFHDRYGRRAGRSAPPWARTATSAPAPCWRASWSPQAPRPSSSRTMS